MEEMRLAEEVILKSLQFGHFGKEIQVLQNLSDKDPMFQNRQNAHTRNEKLKQTSSLFRLDPFLDEKRLRRIGGRLQEATLAYEVKHPNVVPKKSHITELLIRQYRSQDQYHQGCGMTHNALRQAGYWIINGRFPFPGTSESAPSAASFVDLPKSRRWRTSPQNVLLPLRLSHTLVWTFLGLGTLKRAEKN